MTEVPPPAQDPEETTSSEDFQALQRRLGELATALEGTGQRTVRLGQSVITATGVAHLASRTTARLIAALESIDYLQRNALAVGVRANTLRASLGTKLDDLPGGLKIGMEHAVGFMQVGLRSHSKGMLHLANQAKVTGQDSKQIIAGFAKLSAVIPISSDEMGYLGEDMEGLSRNWGIKTTALMEVLERNIDTIGTLAAQGVPFGDAGEVITSLTSRVGQQFQGTIGDLAKQLTFGGGFEDVRQAILRTGDTALVAQMQSGNITEDLLMKIVGASIGHWDSVKGGETNRAVLSELAAIRGINLNQISQFEALNEAYNSAENIEKMHREKVSSAFNESISTLMQEIFVPIQEALLPFLSGLTQFLRDNAEWMKERILGIVKALMVISGALFFIKLKITLMNAKLSWMGGIVGILGSILAWTIMSNVENKMMNAANKAALDDEKAERRRVREHATAERHAWERTLSGARMAWHQSTGASLISGEVVDLLGKIYNTGEAQVHKLDWMGRGTSPWRKKS